jgi:hypothetical protein
MSEPTILRPSHLSRCFAAGLSLCAALPVMAAAQTRAIPDFQSATAGWLAITNDFSPSETGPKPPGYDLHYPFPEVVGRGATFMRISDPSNPNIKPWAAAEMEKANVKVRAGGTGYTARSSCRPAGVPAFLLLINDPVYFLQTPREVIMIFTGNEEVRHVYMNVPHSAHTSPSWYGESVGHYEGDTLVIDTVAQNTETFLDNYRTPHTDKLHVVERWKLAGDKIEARFTVEDPDTFYHSWSGMQHYRRVNQGPMPEEICSAEGNDLLFDFHTPKADKPDF